MFEQTELNKTRTTSDNNAATIQLHEEQLDISKKKVPLCEVKFHREFVTEEKTITVPVKREELVIEKIILNPISSYNAENHIETIRIPISEERFDIDKHIVQLEEITIKNHTFEEIQHINEILKKEKINVKVTGNANVIDTNI